ncbi:hypothetical protein LX36DRAFT_441495 [Colletotrichum falcatum]|nr:hypothetical protein LX36DRAFT_441495 [Colletotrichum falcatum]
MHVNLGMHRSTRQESLVPSNVLHPTSLPSPPCALHKVTWPAPPPPLTVVGGGTVPRGLHEGKKVRQSDLHASGKQANEARHTGCFQHAFVHKTGPCEHERGLAGPSQRLISATSNQAYTKYGYCPRSRRQQSDRGGCKQASVSTPSHQLGPRYLGCAAVFAADAWYPPPLFPPPLSLSLTLPPPF